MHADQLAIDDEVVRQLIAAQFPQWRDERVIRILGDGTMNVIFRIGPRLAARFPLTGADPGQVRYMLEREAAAMSELAASSPFPTPTHVVFGAPGTGYPLPWSVQSWVPGVVASPDGLSDSTLFTRDLITLLRALRNADTAGRTFGGSGRGGDLWDSDGWMERCFAESTSLLPTDDLRRRWGVYRTLPWSDPDRMTHGDLTPGNLLVDGEHLVGVLDGGGFAPADPALDLVSVWHMLSAQSRTALRRELDISPVEWWRGAAWAFQQAMGLVWYYRESNPGRSALGRSTLPRLLDDAEVGSEAAPRI